MFYTVNDAVESIERHNYPSAIGLIFTAIGVPIVLLVKWGMEKTFETVEY